MNAHGTHFNEQQVALDVCTLTEIDNFYDIDQLIEVLSDLLNLELITSGGHC